LIEGSLFSKPNTLWQIDIDPENHQSLEETNLSTPTTGRVYVNLLEGISSICPLENGSSVDRYSAYGLHDHPQAVEE